MFLQKQGNTLLRWSKVRSAYEVRKRGHVVLVTKHERAAQHEYQHQLHKR